MAEIHIERKQRNVLWPVLIGLVVLLLLLWLLMSLLDNDERADSAARTPAVVATDTTALSDESAQPRVDTAVGQPIGQGTGPAPIAPTGQPADAAIGQPAEQTLGTPPAPVFVVPQVDARATPLDPQLRSPYVGRFRSDSMTLVIGEDGNYEITRSPAGPGRGPWTVLREQNVLFLDPMDGSQDRYFRIQDPDTLVPLNRQGEQPAQMTELLRRESNSAGAQ